MAISQSSIFDRTIVWDNHACLPITPAQAEKHVLPALERYRDLGIDVVSINVGYGPVPYEQHIEFLRYLRRRIAELGNRFVLIDSVDDIVAAESRGALSVCFDVEGAAPIDAQLTRVATFYELGVRWMLIAYNQNNAFGGGCHEDDGGLTALGKKLIAEMNRVGMVACCSHTGYRTALDVIDTSATPVVFSHSNPRALKAHPRNIPDELIRACARRGGVVGINGVGIFLGDNDASPERMAQHIDYVVQLVGVDHVGIGTDFTFGMEEFVEEISAASSTFPPGWGYDLPIEFLPPEHLQRVVELLWQRGYTDEHLAAILGGNLMRIAREVWKSPT